jgi:histone acetyltransferase 1
VAELTVEDPAEAFEDLRDRNDLRMLRSHAQFMLEGFGEPESYGGGKVQKGKGKGKAKSGSGKLDPPAEKGWVEKWRTSLKIAGVGYRLFVFIICIEANFVFLSDNSIG